MNKKRLLFFGIICLLLLSAFVGVFSVRSRVSQTEQTLGPAAAGLSPLQRFRLAWKCADNLDRFTAPVNPAQGQFLLDIQQGENVNDVIAKIASGLFMEPEVMRLYWIYTGADRLINPGRFVLHGSMTIPQITDLVTAAGESLVRFAFFSGMRLEEIAALIDTYDFTFTGAKAQAFRAGFEYIPNVNDVRYYYRRFAYRAGFLWKKSYFAFNNVQQETLGVSLGVTLPVFRLSNGLTFAVK